MSQNLDGVITILNRSAQRVFGYAAEEAIARPIANRQSTGPTELTAERSDDFELSGSVSRQPIVFFETSRAAPLRGRRGSDAVRTRFFDVHQLSLIEVIVCS